MNDRERRLAIVHAHGHVPHRFVPGQMRKGLTICADCAKAELYAAHDPDLRTRPDDRLGPT